MGKNVFVPPFPRIDPPSQETLDKLVNMTRKDRKQFKKSEEYLKYVKPVLDREKKNRRSALREWLWDKGIIILNTILALIAAVTGIIALLR